MKKFTLVVLTTLIQYWVVMATHVGFEGWVMAVVIIGNAALIHAVVEWSGTHRSYDRLMDVLSVNVTGIVGVGTILAGSVPVLIAFLALSLVAAVSRTGS